jgi:D-threo-aldose 1-dehydrogenase
VAHTELPRRAVGKTGVALSILGFGGVQVGDYFVKISDAQAAGALESAWAHGIRYFDTAPLYGRGLSEHRVGGALRYRPRDEFVLSTKTTRNLVPDNELATDPARRGLPFRLVSDFSYDGARRGVEQSLHRLGLSRIDFAFIHDLEPRAYGDAYPEKFREAIAGCYRALDDMRREGTIRGIGAGLNEAPACMNLMQAADLDCLMLAGRYTLLEQQTLDDVLPLAEEKGVGIIIGAPFNSGVLASGATADARYNNKPLEPALRERVLTIESICAQYRVPLPAAALQFPLAHPAVVSIVAGMASAEEVKRNVGHITREIPPAFWRTLQSEGLIRADAPVPGAT